MATCPKCGSVYNVEYHHSPMRDYDKFNCEVCGYEMDKWNSTTWLAYTLVERHEPVEKPE